MRCYEPMATTRCDMGKKEGGGRVIIKDTVAFAMSQLRRNAMLQKIEPGFLKQNYEDIRQELYLMLLANNVPLTNWDQKHYRVIMSCLSKAVYNVRRQLGYRRVPSGWVKEMIIDAQEEKGVVMAHLAVNFNT